MGAERGPTLTEATVRELARTQSYERGATYYDSGAVGEVVLRGGTIRADVEGSQFRPYTVTVEFDDSGIARTDCSCPYDHGGICKHRVAVLLTYVRDPDRVSHEQRIPELIADTDRDTLEDLLVELLERRPEMASWIESRLGASRAETTTEVSVDLDSIHRRATDALPDPGPGGHGDAYTQAERMAEELDALIQEARAVLDADDGETALDVLDVIAEVLAENSWTGLVPYDVPAVYEALGDLGEAFTEAILTADLTESERIEWERRLQEWVDEHRHFMDESTFAVAAEAARVSWDDDRLQQALEGGVDEGEFWTGEPTPDEEDLVAARLAVLERQGRLEEFCNLALAAGRSRDYAEMLVQKGRIEEAVEFGIDRLSNPVALLGLARTLHEQDHTAAALTVAERGLTGHGYGSERLAVWTRDLAASAGESDLALEAAVTAFEASPSLQSYQAVEETAGDDWEEIRLELLESLQERDASFRTAGQMVAVFLYEGMYDQAIQIANSSGSASVVEPVVEEVLDERPDWAIGACKQQAEPIIEQGQHDSYRTAVRWLEHAGRAARASGELDEWCAYVEDLRDEHHRKYKLRPMLEDLLEEFTD